jgi:hypothetical protein
MDRSKIPENISIFTEDVLDQLPDDFIIQGGTEGLTFCTISGAMGEWGITIKYNFNEEIDAVYVKAISVNGQIVEGNVSLNELKKALQEL